MHSLIYSAVSVPTLQAVIKVRMLDSKKDSVHVCTCTAFINCEWLLSTIAQQRNGKIVPRSDRDGGGHSHDEDTFLMMIWIVSVILAWFYDGCTPSLAGWAVYFIYFAPILWLTLSVIVRICAIFRTGLHRLHRYRMCWFWGFCVQAKLNCLLYFFLFFLLPESWQVFHLLIRGDGPMKFFTA